ncbi:hypothetical protein D3C86_1131460 [compost metagenome]|nr:hypothetical protein L902_32990 [Agrobacterium radiobacter DSM 30147]
MGLHEGIGRGHAVAMNNLGFRFFRKPRLQQHGKSNGIFNQKDFILHGRPKPPWPVFTIFPQRRIFVIRISANSKIGLFIVVEKNAE